MDVIAEFLIPGVKNLQDGKHSAKPFEIRGKLKQGFGAATMQKVVQKLLICVKERIQLMRDRKDHMKYGVSMTSARHLSTQISLFSA